MGFSRLDEIVQCVGEKIEESEDALCCLVQKQRRCFESCKASVAGVDAADHVFIAKLPLSSATSFPGGPIRGSNILFARIQLCQDRI